MLLIFVFGLTVSLGFAGYMYYDDVATMEDRYEEYS